MANSSDQTAPSLGGDREAPERVVEGIALAPGIAIGTAHRYAPASAGVECQRIPEEAVADEIHLFEEALDRVDHDLDRVIAISREKLGADSTAIFEAHRLMLRDDELIHPVRRRIREDRQNASYAVKAVLEQHRRRLEASDDEYLRERASDLSDIQNRIIQQLRRGKMSTEVDADTVVVADHLGAADVIRFSNRGVRGCVSTHGGATSHVALIARALNVPTVGGLPDAMEHVTDGAPVIVDGLQGRLIIHPTDDTLAFYRERQARHQELVLQESEYVSLPAETKDGYRVQLLANIEFQQELPLIEDFGAEGIGLLRTEMLFLMRQSISLSEAEQYDAYKDIVQTVAPGVSTIRLLDLGGDKMLPLAHREHNPFLGWRGIRVLLDRPELLRPQLRALLRASVHGPVQILLPMVTHRDEISRFKAVMQTVRSELIDEGHPVADPVPVGMMVEVPAVALRAETFAPEVDFFSIGTNDLTQYVLAIDRSNDLVGERYDPLHPAVLQLIQRTIEAGRAHRIPVSLCGEMGGTPSALPLLVGLGLTTVSASPTYLPALKRVIRSIRRTDARALAEEALRARDVDEVHALNTEWLRIHAPDTLELALGDEVSSLPPDA